MDIRQHRGKIALREDSLQTFELIRKEMKNHFITSTKICLFLKSKDMYLTQRNYALERGATRRKNWVLRWDLKMKGHHVEI